MAAMAKPYIEAPDEDARDDCGMEVRRLAPHEWQVLRSLRLAALRDSPDWFWSTYDEEVERPDEWWQRSARDVAWFIAHDSGRPVGLAAALRSPELPETERHVISMWVEPAARGRGIGRSLIEQIKEWARADGAESLHLEVTATNAAATHLYEACGFQPTGVTKSLPRKPSLIEREMRLSL